MILMHPAVRFGQKSLRFLYNANKTLCLKSFRTVAPGFKHNCNIEDMSVKKVDRQLGVIEFGRQIDFEECEKITNLCLNEGITWLDTALMYNAQNSERMIGQLDEQLKSKINIATKAYVNFSDKGFAFDGIVEQLNQSLKNMNVGSVDLFYLHFPDHKTPIEETLRACNHLHKQGKFKEFGISNYAAWEVAEIYYICKANGWICPTVYQGMYNPLTRRVEDELFPCLRKFGIRFYAYNMLAGGLLTGKHKREDDPENETKLGRFYGTEKWPSNYRNRFWRPEYFDGVEDIENALKECYGDSVGLIEACFRWMNHHSMLSGHHNDGIILGCSSFQQLQNNLIFTEKGPLDQSVVDAFDKAWDRVNGVCPKYNR